MLAHNRLSVSETIVIVARFCEGIWSGDKEVRGEMSIFVGSKIW